jgi:hypothetical protein
MSTEPAGPAPSYAPYQDPATDQIYNLLFCDDPNLWRTSAPLPPDDPRAVLLVRAPNVRALQRIAADTRQESRYRALAFDRLRACRVDVPAKIILGVIVEVRLEDGLDALAAYADGRVRYINHSGRMAFFESDPPAVEEGARALVRVAQPLVDRIGPWERRRLPSPKPGRTRISFLVSDGLYFGEARFEDLLSDPLAGPVLQAAQELLQAVVDASPETPDKE